MSYWAVLWLNYAFLCSLALNIPFVIYHTLKHMNGIVMIGNNLDSDCFYKALTHKSTLKVAKHSKSS